jgi:hypothetical protein
MARTRTAIPFNCPTAEAQIGTERHFCSRYQLANLVIFYTRQVYANRLLRRPISVAPVLILFWKPATSDGCIAKAGTVRVSLRGFHTPASEAGITDVMPGCFTLSNGQFPYITAAFAAAGTATNGVSE